MIGFSNTPGSSVGKPLLKFKAIIKLLTHRDLALNIAISSLNILLLAPECD